MTTQTREIDGGDKGECKRLLCPVSTEGWRSLMGLITHRASVVIDPPDQRQRVGGH